MKTGLNHAVRVTVAALSIVLGHCAAVPAAAQCPGDVIPSGSVNGTDLAELLATWGPCSGCAADIDASGSVDGNDLAVILGAWGPCSPVIASILPNTGPTSGGTAITITGNYFSGSATVTLGGVPATNVQVVSATTITAVTPTASAGTVDVVVTIGGRTGTLARGFTFKQIVPGAVRAWGLNDFGQSDIPADLGPCIAIGGGGRHTIALCSDGTVRAWGRNNHGQCNIPPNLGPCTAIAAGGLHTIALRDDGSVRAWGAGWTTGVDPHYGQSIVPADLGPCTAIAAGFAHSVALRVNGTVKAWGAGGTNTGFYPNYGQRIPPSALDPCTAIAAGAFHTLVIEP